MREEYSKVLLAEQVRSAKENRGIPSDIPVGRREELLKQAELSVHTGLHVDLKHMRDSLGHLDSTPMGGAKDD